MSSMLKLRQAEMEGDVRGIAASRESKPIQVFLADNSLSFCQATAQNCEKLVETLSK